jgi:hypothetical protein
MWVRASVGIFYLNFLGCVGQTKGIVPKLKAERNCYHVNIDYVLKIILDKGLFI